MLKHRVSFESSISKYICVVIVKGDTISILTPQFNRLGYQSGSRLNLFEIMVTVVMEPNSTLLLFHDA